MTIKRGQVYYIDRGYSAGSEQWAGRPGIIVSNDQNNAHSRTVEVVYLTTQPKMDLPTHAPIRSLDRDSTALCEQITSVSVERLGDYLGAINDAEMVGVELAMMNSLDIPVEPPAEEQEEAELERLEAAYDRLRHELIAEKAKTDALRWAYEALVAQIVTKGGS